MERPGGEIQDFDAVVSLYWPRLLRFVMASVRDQDTAETLVQDCFLRAYRARARFRGDASLQTWLMQIAVNLVRDHARSRRLQFWRRAGISAVNLSAASERIADGRPSPEARTLVREQVEAIWNATARLPERQRTVFLLRFVEDMQLLEIAAVTGMKEGTVKVHLFRALQAVRKRMESRT